MIIGGAAALSAGPLSVARPAWGAAPNSPPKPPSGVIRKPLFRVVLAGKEAAAAEAASLAKALAGTARNLEIDLDLGSSSAGAPDGLLIVALGGKKHEALAEADKRGTAPAVVLCPGAQRPAPGKVWQLGESKAGLLVGASKEEEDAVYGLRMLNAAWKSSGNARTTGTGHFFKTYADDLKEILKDKRAREEAEAIAEYYMKEAEEIRVVTWKDLVNASLVYLFLRRIVTANKYEGLSMDGCMRYYSAAGTNPCIAAARLLDEGIPAACEGDRTGMNLQLLTHWLFGRPSYIGEGQPTVHNTRTSAHCTAPTRLSGYDQPHEPFELMSHSESGRGIAPAVKWRIGQEVTVMVYNGNVGTGRVVSNSKQPPNGGCRTSVEFTVDGMANVSVPDFNWHYVLVYGNVEKELDAYWMLVNGKTPGKLRDVDSRPVAGPARAEAFSPAPSCACCRWAHCPRA